MMEEKEVGRPKVKLQKANKISTALTATFISTLKKVALSLIKIDLIEHQTQDEGHENRCHECSRDFMSRRALHQHYMNSRVHEFRYLYPILISDVWIAIETFAHPALSDSI
jgi:hypothetical protein